MPPRPEPRAECRFRVCKQRPKLERRMASGRRDPRDTPGRAQLVRRSHRRRHERALAAHDRYRELASRDVVPELERGSASATDHSASLSSLARILPAERRCSVASCLAWTASPFSTAATIPS